MIVRIIKQSHILSLLYCYCIYFNWFCVCVCVYFTLINSQNGTNDCLYKFKLQDLQTGRVGVRAADQWQKKRTCHCIQYICVLYTIIPDNKKMPNIRAIFITLLRKLRVVSLSLSTACWFLLAPPNDSALASVQLSPAFVFSIIGVICGWSGYTVNHLGW